MKNILNNNSYIKGELTEIKVGEWLKRQPQFKVIEKFVKTPHGTEGVDFEAFYGNKQKIAIQIKNWSKNIPGKEFHSFVKVLKDPEKNYQKGILISIGKHKLTDSALKELKNINVTIFYNPNLEEETTSFSAFSLRPYQQEAVDKAITYYRSNDRGILEMACGTGKTFVAKNIIKSLLPQGGLVFFFAPWLSLLEQSINFLSDSETVAIPVCSTEEQIIAKNNQKEEDVNQTNLMNLENLLTSDYLNQLQTKYKYIIIFCTYQSQDRLKEKQDKKLLPKADLMICDEAHHTVEKNALDNDNNHIHDNIKAKKTLYMTATVKIYLKKPKTEYNRKDNLEIIDMSDKSIYGDIFYSYDLNQAIDEKFLSDYEIFYPRFVEIEELEQIDSALSPKEKDLSDSLINKKYGKAKNEKEQLFIEKIRTQERLNYIARMVGINKILQERNCQSALAFVNGNTKNRAQQSARFMKAILEQTNEINNKKTKKSFPTEYKLKTDYIEGLMNPSQRSEKLSKLNTENPFLLYNCRCLTEGVDIPHCDAVVFFEPKQSFVELIQAIGRALRKDPNNPNKKATIIFPLRFDDKYQTSLINKESLKALSLILSYHKTKKNNKYLPNPNPDPKKTPDKGLNIKKFEQIPKNVVFNNQEQEVIAFAQRFIQTQLIKIDKTNWKHLSRNIVANLKEIQSQIIAKNSSNKVFQKIKTQFGTILNIDETDLSNEETALIISQYILFYPLLMKIYQIDFPLHQELDKYINELEDIETLRKTKIDDLVDVFEQKLKFEFKDLLSEKEHIFDQIYNDVIKKLEPDLKEDYGIYYTPKFVVEILWDVLLKVGQLDFKKYSYNIIDPASGSGIFITHFIKNVLGENDDLKNKYYNNFLHLREIYFMSYMVSCFRLAIAANKHEICPNVHWGDTLKNESKRKGQIVEQFKSSQKEFTIVITNPPWKNQQKKDEGNKKPLYVPPKNNKDNDLYWVDERIRETFIANTWKKTKNSLYNMYRRFVRWSLDKINKNNQGGWLAMVLPESFLEEGVEGFRFSLVDECDKIYIINLRGGGSIYDGKDPQKEGENIFHTETQDGNQQGTVLLLCHKPPKASSQTFTNETYYHKIPDGLNNKQKEEYLSTNFQKADFFEKITLDEERHWFYQSEKAPKKWQALTLTDQKESNKLDQDFSFKSRNDGIVTACDEFVYDDNYDNLTKKMNNFIAFYNECRLAKKIIEKPNIIKWHQDLRKKCLNNVTITFDSSKIRTASKTPFHTKYLYFEPLIIKSIHKQDTYYQKNNLSLCVNYNTSFFSCLVVDKIPDKSLLFQTTKCYPLSDCIPQNNYNSKDWMAILYALFHHEKYREKAKNFLRKHLPTVPPLNSIIQKKLLSQGKKLMNIHLNYDQLKPTSVINSGTDKKQIPSGFRQYHKDMPYVPEIALEYCLTDKPLLYVYRKSGSFTQLVTLAIDTANIQKEINKIDLKL